MIRLYEAGMSTCAQKVRFTLEQKGLPWEGITVDLHGGENYSPEFRKINPKAIIPVLDDDGDMIYESNSICIYLDEKYPEKPLMPADPKGRADVRELLQAIDEQIHHDSSALTYGIAFRPGVRAKYDTEEKLQGYLNGMPDAGRRASKGDVIRKGVESTECTIAVQRLSLILSRLEEKLQNSAFLVGDQLTIADIAYSPYMTRLTHLKLAGMWADKPAVSDWFDRVVATEGYQKGLAAYFNPEVVARMEGGGEKAWPTVQSIMQA